MHQALYRKWRPKTFADVCGQDHITSILKYQVENHKTSHAYLFCGSRGTGKTTCAKILAKAVNCEHPENGNPCGECPACRSADSGSSMDIVEMDAASNNGVDDIRKIRDEVEYLPAELSYKVYIIDEVHMLSPSAFNALLKTLEEPPAHVIFILATTELQKIPATILSRCQRYDFRRIPTDVIAGRLDYIAENENITLDHEAAFLLAHLAQGGMRDAISLLELCAGDGRAVTPELVEEIAGTGGRDVILRVLNAICEKDYDTIFSEVGKLFASSKDLTVFVTDLIAFYRDMLVVKTTKEARAYLDLSERQYAELSGIAARFSTETLIAHTKLLDGTLSAMRSADSSKRLLTEMTLVRMCDDRFSTSAEALAVRITALEDKINAGVFRTVPAAEAPKEVTQESPTEEQTVTAPEPAGETAPVKKEYFQLPYWPEFVQKCTERDPMLGSFLAETAKGYTVSTDAFVHIRTSNEMARSIIANMFDTLLEVLNTFENGRLTPGLVKLEYVPEKKNDRDSDLDELIRQGN